MEQQRSVLAPQLEALGFDEWSSEDMVKVTESDDWMTGLLNGRMSFFRPWGIGFAFTIAIDEFGNMWTAEGTIDLIRFGFTELFINPDGTLAQDLPQAN